MYHSRVKPKPHLRKRLLEIPRNASRPVLNLANVSAAGIALKSVVAKPPAWRRAQAMPVRKIPRNRLCRAAGIAPGRGWEERHAVRNDLGASFI